MPNAQIYSAHFLLNTDILYLEIIMKKIWNIYKKHEEIFNYLVVGVMTTIVSLVFYFLSTRTFLNPNVAFELGIANIIKWISGVIFAYFANKIFVFKSKRKDLVKEFVEFSASRVRTLILDIVVMDVLVIKMGVFDAIATLISQVLVTVGNYITGKFIVFRKKKDKK